MSSFLSALRFHHSLIFQIRAVHEQYKVYGTVSQTGSLPVQGRTEDVKRLLKCIKILGLNWFSFMLGLFNVSEGVV